MNTSNKAMQYFGISFFVLILTLPIQVLSQEDLFLKVGTSNPLTQVQDAKLRSIIAKRTTGEVEIVRISNINKLYTQNVLSLSFFGYNGLQFKKRKSHAWFSETDKFIHATLIGKGENIIGRIRVRSELYAIEPLGEGLHAVVKVNNSGRFWKDSVFVNPRPNKNRGQNLSHLSSNPARLHKSMTNTVIEVLVAYTPAVEDGGGDFIGQIQGAVEDANTSYILSEIPIELRLAHIQKVDYVESGSFILDLDRFHRSDDIYMNEIHSLRDQYGVDVCMLILDPPPPYTLSGYAMQYDNANPDRAFAVMDFGYIYDYTFAHEIGHIQGADHDIRTDPVNHSGFEYGHGYINQADNWRTIMAYADPGCADGYCQGIQYWSNPNKTYGGDPMGTIEYEDNARVLTETASDVAWYRSSNNIYVPEDYPTISEALASASSGQTVIVGDLFPYQVIDGVSVPSGVTLKIIAGSNISFSTFTPGSTLQVNNLGSFVIDHGSTLNFYNNTGLTVYGTLNATGVTTQPVIFTKAGASTPGSWGSVKLDGNGASNSNLSNVIVKYGAGVQFLNGANAIIQNSEIEYNTYGIYFYNSAPQILNNKIRFNTEHAINGTTSGLSPRIYDNTITRTASLNYAGILLSGTHGNIIHNDVSGFDVGMFFNGGSNPWFKRYNGTTPNPNNRIKLCNNGIEVSWGSNPVLGNSEVIPTWGNSSIYKNYNYNIYARNGSSVVADLNWYGCDDPALYADGTSYIYAEALLTQDPWGSTCKEEIIVGPSDGERMLKGINFSHKSKGEEITSLEGNRAELLKGLRLRDQGDYRGAFDHFVSMYNNDKLPAIALSNIASLYIESKNLEVEEFLSSKKEVTSTLQPFIASSLAKIAHLKGNLAVTKNLFDEVISRFPNTEEARDAMLRKFYMAVHEEKNKSAAENILSSLQSLYSGHDIEFAQYLFETADFSEKDGFDESSQDKDAKLNKNEGQVVHEFRLLQNHPNPFNPSTMISYSIGVDGMASLQVFDVLGRLVSTLVNENKTVGNYEVSFDASKLPSGIYFYSLQSGNKHDVKKMLLIK